MVDEEETTNMRELVQAIDAHANPEVSSTLHAPDDEQSQQPRAEDTATQLVNEAAQPPTANQSI